MPSSELPSNNSSQVSSTRTREQKEALRERLNSLPSPEEMRQKLQQLLDYSREIVRLGELILDEKRH